MAILHVFVVSKHYVQLMANRGKSKHRQHEFKANCGALPPSELSSQANKHGASVVRSAVAKITVLNVRHFIRSWPSAFWRRGCLSGAPQTPRLFAHRAIPPAQGRNTCKRDHLSLSEHAHRSIATPPTAFQRRQNDMKHRRHYPSRPRRP